MISQRVGPVQGRSTRTLVALMVLALVATSGCSAATALGLGFYAVHYNYSHAHDRDDDRAATIAPRPLMTAESKERCEEKRRELSARAAVAADETTRVHVLGSMPNCLDSTWDEPTGIAKTELPPPTPKPPAHHSVGLWMLTGFALGLVVDATTVLVVAASAGS